ncbi:MAG: amidohydrolase, partial [Rhodobacteraceae bacterium]|nr:amidohydrolase [Paracoccaceae bacterium]
MNKIDAHHHCWSISRQDYHWIEPGHATWARDYLPRHLDPARRAAGVDKTILVQAAWTLAETNYLLGLADATDWIAGVIGWVDFEDPTQHEQIARFANHPKLIGLRPMVQEIPQDDWVLRDDLTWAFEAIQHF